MTTENARPGVVILPREFRPRPDGRKGISRKKA
jgi:hypothetical protein